MVDEYAKALLEYVKSKQYKVYNRMLIFVEDVDKRWQPTKDNFYADQYNDRGIILDTIDIPEILLDKPATNEPGVYYTMNPLNPDGAFCIGFGQFEAWKVGTHKQQYPALVQTRPVSGTRDRNKDGQRTGDKAVSGMYGINIHSGGDNGKIGRWSAGCSVFDNPQDTTRAIKLLLEYPTPNGLITATFIAGDEFARFRKDNSYDF